jgi:gas vesicle protein
MSRDNSGSVLVAFFIGALTGAAVALLMAPATGEETRRLLGQKAREGRERAGEAARQGREFVNRQRETLNEAVQKGRDAYRQARQGSGGESV